MQAGWPLRHPSQPSESSGGSESKLPGQPASGGTGRFPGRAGRAGNSKGCFRPAWWGRMVGPEAARAVSIRPAAASSGTLEGRRRRSRRRGRGPASGACVCMWGGESHVCVRGRREGQRAGRRERERGREGLRVDEDVEGRRGGRAALAAGHGSPRHGMYEFI